MSAILTRAAISLTREGDELRLSFGYSPALVEAVKSLPYATFDKGTRTWTARFSEQALRIMRPWVSRGWLAEPAESLLAPGERPRRVARGRVERGTVKRPLAVRIAMRGDGTYERLKEAADGRWDKVRRVLTFAPMSVTALTDLVSSGFLEDPEGLLERPGTVVAFDVRTGLFAVRGDDARAESAFRANFPTVDVMSVWRERGLEVGFADSFSREVYRGEIARAAPLPPHPDLNVELRDYQRRNVAVALERTGFGIFDEPGLGKGSPDSEPILTPSGWTTYGRVQVGDEVIGSDGRATRVTGVFPRGELAVFRVSMSDGTSVVVDGDHLWDVVDPELGQRVVRETRELMAALEAGAVGFDVPLVQPVEFAAQGDLPESPYWSGVFEVMAESYDRDGRASLDPKLLMTPVAYRVHILSGILDCAVRPAGTFSSSSTKLVSDVAFLVRSLGGVASVEDDGRLVRFSVPAGTWALGEPASHLPRTMLASRAGEWLEAAERPSVSRWIVAIEPAGRERVTCISVAAQDRLYVARDFIVTHNTVQAIAVGHTLLSRSEVSRVCVLVPGVSRSQWVQEIVRFTGVAADDVAMVGGTALKRHETYRQAADKKWLVVHYDVLARDLEALLPLFAGSLVVSDEAHRLKTWTAERTVAALELAQRAARRLALSGTPLETSVSEWYQVLSGFAVPGVLGSPEAYNERYRHATAYDGYVGARNLDELRQRSAPHYGRHLKAEVAADLPLLQVEQRLLDVPKEYHAVLRRAHEEAAAEIAAGAAGGGALAGGAEVGTAELTAVGQLRLLCASPRLLHESQSTAAAAMVTAGLAPEIDGPKLDELREMARRFAARSKARKDEGVPATPDSVADERFVVFSHSQRMVALISQRLTEDGVKHVVFDGTTSVKAREAARLAFNDPGSDLIAFVATDAAAESLNLGKCCSTLVQFDPPWTPSRAQQRMNRIHRLDGTAPAYRVINLTLAGTVEQAMYRTLAARADTADAVMGEEGLAARTTGRRVARSVFDEALEETMGR